MSIKAMGQVFTPVKIVNIILDNIGYKGKNILTKKIIEPSFGKGVFLIEIVNRIIEESRKQNKNNEEIKNIIVNNVFGVEIDEALYNETIRSLNLLLLDKGIPNIDFSKNLFNDDAIKMCKTFNIKFDYVVGNPPYVRIHNIEKEDRRGLKLFPFTTGTTDLYVVFYAIGIYLLNDSGILGYITPNSFLRNKSQNAFRNYLIEEKLIQKIYDFKSSCVFKNAATYTCICILNKSDDKNKEIEWKEYNVYDVVSENTYKYDLFKKSFFDKPWILSNKSNTKFLNDISKSKYFLGDFTCVQNGISTNKDSIFIGKAFLDKNCKTQYDYLKDNVNYVYFNGFKIEAKILKPCIKASKLNDKNKYIIFPYEPKKEVNINKSNKKIFSNFKPITEDIIKKIYPFTYKYLLYNKEILSRRDMEKNTPWYCFARSQGLLNLGYKKIVFNRIISKNSCMKNNILIANEDTVVYSGFYITLPIEKFFISNDNCLDVDLYSSKLLDVKNVIVSDDFYKYCCLSGKDMSGNYISVSTKTVKDYKINVII